MTQATERKEATERKSGHYWIKLNKDSPWIAARWYEGFVFWMITGVEDAIDDDDVCKVNENRIMTPDEWE